MIYFIRHGETDCNKAHICQGHLDVPLNDTGISQAQNARDSFSELVFDEIYSSPLQRAKLTAEIINEKHNAKLMFDDRLKEVNCGILQGRCLLNFSNEQRQYFFDNPKEFNAESTKELCDRVEAFFKAVENSNKNILIVAHGGVYRALYRYINKIEGYHFETQKVKNAEFMKIKD